MAYYTNRTYADTLLLLIKQNVFHCLNNRLLLSDLCPLINVIANLFKPIVLSVKIINCINEINKHSVIINLKFKN